MARGRPPTSNCPCSARPRRHWPCRHPWCPADRGPVRGRIELRVAVHHRSGRRYRPRRGGEGGSVGALRPARHAAARGTHRRPLRCPVSCRGRHQHRTQLVVGVTTPVAARVPCVGVVDDHAVVRDGTAGAPGSRARHRGRRRCRHAGAATALLELAPDVLVVDIRIGEQNGLELVRDLAADGPAVAVLTSFDYPQFVDAALRLGASGYVLKMVRPRRWSMRSGRPPRAGWPTRSDRHEPDIGHSAPVRSASCHSSSKAGRTRRSPGGSRSASRLWRAT